MHDYARCPLIDCVIPLDTVLCRDAAAVHHVQVLSAGLGICTRQVSRKTLNDSATPGYRSCKIKEVRR